MRRSFAGLLFAVAFAFACLAISGFLMHRTAFTPSHAADAARTVMADEAVRLEAVKVIADGTADQMYPGDANGAAIVRQNIATVAGIAAGADLYGPMLEQVHAVLIGEQDGPVVVPPDQLVLLSRDERAAVLPPVQVEVPELTVLRVTDTLLGWLVPLSAAVSVIFFVLCSLARPERGAVPHARHRPPRARGAGDRVRLRDPEVPAARARRQRVGPDAGTRRRHRTQAHVRTGVRGRGGGARLVRASTRMGRSRRWSTPVSTYRYREERSWS
ncbi:MAG: hypothetical protein R2713_00895 [Ilumatobacteraceae bacterium]